MNTNLTKLCSHSLYRKKEYVSSKFHDKLKKEKINQIVFLLIENHLQKIKIISQ